MKSGQHFAFKATAVNTGPVTLNGKVLPIVNSDGSPLVTGDWTEGGVVTIEVFDEVAIVKEPLV